MKILVAPLNWGLGHASRCVPLVHRFLNEGHEVILGGDGESLTLLRKHFPQLRYVYLAPLHLRYSKSKRQVWAMMKALPSIIAWAVKDHAILQSVLQEEPIDRVVSDNRFGLFSKRTECIYITHQLHILLPKGWQWAEGIAERLHAYVCNHYNRVWIPDYEAPEKSLAGILSHPKKRYKNAEYIGPLSRFQHSQIPQNKINMDILAVLSGLEPQRTIFEQEIIARYRGKEEKVLIVQGLPHRPNTRFKRGNITIVPYLGDKELVEAMLHAKKIIARSGYSTIMDLEALGLMDKAELIPTPGQPEQEYLALLLCKN
jgi:uncharacterized protein (TIGR00661 family)